MPCWLPTEPSSSTAGVHKQACAQTTARGQRLCTHCVHTRWRRVLLPRSTAVRALPTGGARARCHCAGCRAASPAIRTTTVCRFNSGARSRSSGCCGACWCRSIRRPWCYACHSRLPGRSPRRTLPRQRSQLTLQVGAVAPHRHLPPAAAGLGIGRYVSDEADGAVRARAASAYLSDGGASSKHVHTVQRAAVREHQHPLPRVLRGDVLYRCTDTLMLVYAAGTAWRGARQSTARGQHTSTSSYGIHNTSTTTRRTFHRLGSGSWRR